MPNPATADRDLSQLAPKFRAAVEAAIAECIAGGFDVAVAEALRSQERQAYLYAQGRTRPGKRVTNAPTNLTSWHGYGLAIDFMDRKKGFDPVEGNDEPWFRDVAAIFKKHGLSWGGDWHSGDTPHIQWGSLPASPQASHKSLKQMHGNPAVWAAVGASDGHIVPPINPTLRSGAQGDAVVRLQRALATHGNSIHLTVDGSFGLATDAAVKTFQSSHGLTADGLVGPKTWAALGI